MDEHIISIIVSAVLLVFSIISGVIAFIKGRKQKTITSQLTEEEQKSDLRRQMIDECSSVERFSKFLKTSMTKTELSQYKYSTVLKNITLYAKANSYAWYCESVWGEEITKYINDANAVSGKTAKTN